MNIMHVLVKNAPNTASLDPARYGYNSWREYWENNGGRRFYLFYGLKRISVNGRRKWALIFKCPACGRNFLWDGEAPDCFDGCHVNIVGDISKKLYITPLCHTCNQQNVIARVSKVNLIPAP